MVKCPTGINYNVNVDNTVQFVICLSMVEQTL